LLELKDNFTRYNISNILKLRSAYSIQVFELLTQYKTIGNRTITIDEFRKLLKIPNTYTNKDIRVMIESVQKDLK
ncbi:replication initiation protein, partial [Aliarcobacter butzleri]